MKAKLNKINAEKENLEKELKKNQEKMDKLKKK